MPWTDLPLPQKIYQSADSSELPQGLGERMVDMFISELSNYNKRPGLEEFSDLGTNSSVDGVFWDDNFTFMLAVSGGSIFRLDNAGVKTDITGDSLLLGKKVVFSTDGTTIVMANGGRMVTYDGSGTTAYMADADAPTEVDFVAFINGYMLANSVGTKKFFFSDPTNILSWGANDFFSAVTDPDKLVAITVTNKEIALWGPSSIELWWNTTGSPVFSPFETGLIQSGVISQNTIQETDGMYLYLDDERRFRVLQGRTYKELSAPFDDVIRELVDVADARSMMIHIGNRSFYVVTFRGDNRTFAYDLTTDLWHEWGNWNAGTGKYDKFIADAHAYSGLWNLHIVGGNADGKLYKLGFNFEDDAGDTIRSVIRTAPITHGTYVRKRCNGLRFRMLRGLGTGMVEPMFHIRWRDDGGPWSNEYPISLGKIGDTEYFARINKLGQYRSRQWEIIHTYGVDFRLAAIEENIEVMKS